MIVEPYTEALALFPRHSIFDALVDGGEATRVIATSDDGAHFGWQLSPDAAAMLGITDPDRVALAGLRTPSAAKLAAMAAAKTAGDAAIAKDAQARTVIENQVAAIKAKAGAPGSWTPVERFQLAVAWILHRLD